LLKINPSGMHSMREKVLTQGLAAGVNSVRPVVRFPDIGLKWALG